MAWTRLDDYFLLNPTHWFSGSMFISSGVRCRPLWNTETELSTCCDPLDSSQSSPSPRFDHTNQLQRDVVAGQSNVVAGELVNEWGSVKVRFHTTELTHHLQTNDDLDSRVSNERVFLRHRPDVCCYAASPC